MQILGLSENDWRFIADERLDSETKPNMAPGVNDSGLVDLHGGDMTNEM
jgi:hypothetical protein